MPLIDLTRQSRRAATRAATPAAPAVGDAAATPHTSAFDDVPRRVTLTIAELRHAAALAGDAPLPFDVVEPEAAGQHALERRLGNTDATSSAQTYLDVARALPDPERSLTGRGLVTDAGLDLGLAGALGLLATPHLAADLDVVVDDVRFRAWHRQAGEAVAALATTDGIVFELAWFGVGSWGAEIARVAALPAEFDLETSSVPRGLDLPYELADAVVEAGDRHRADLVRLLAARYDGAVRDDQGAALDSARTIEALDGLMGETRGRLRALVARIDAPPADTVHATDGVGDEAPPIGVRSWTLVRDGWRSLRPHHDGDTLRIRADAVSPDQLAGDLALVLAELAVTSGGTR
ncbi:hypothetical protein [Nocardioides sp. R-C-SC26]|uniref:hypothetical protein n=1 Tax=Nocardioides sp. R-C-SC26 TaxID=2870414 RepID=UPI001E34AF3C|nr:hypothetical protein [Nocardioides sp. R-C-SC26]